MLDVQTLTLTGARRAIGRKELSARELTDSCLARIENKNPELNAYLEIWVEEARAEAEAIDRKIAAGEELGVLAGIPLALKDNVLIKGRRASAGSKILRNYVAAYDATVVGRLRRAGAIFVGRTNLDEFAMGSSTEHSAYGPTRHPLDGRRVPGGSSGGSAAAVADGLCLGALGSETGGSVRQPASFCGVAGLKPTYGAVSRHGLIALASSLDQIGPFAKNLEDLRLLFETIRGGDEYDATSVAGESERWEQFPPKKTPVVGVPFAFFAEGVEPTVRAGFDESLKRLERAGCRIEEVDLSNLKYALACYYVIMPAEASTNLARYDGLRYGEYRSGSDLMDDYFKTRGEGFGPEPRRRILLGTFVLSAGYKEAFYGRARAVRRLLDDDFRRVFEKVDAIATPTTPSPAFLRGEKTADPVQMYLADIFTAPANLAGLPALSVPSPSAGPLPSGFQLVGPRFSEDRLFDLAAKIFP